jgi:hypothetical protein
MDPSQRPAEPLQPVDARTLIRNLQGAEPIDDSPEAENNRMRAAAEISAIFELNKDRNFQWFMREFIDRPYNAAFDALRNPLMRQKDDTLEVIQAKYVALRDVKVGMLEREIAHRELLNPRDEEIPRLRERLSRL